MSVRLRGTTHLPLKGFSWNLVFVFFFFRKSVEEIQVSFKSDENNGHFTWRQMKIFDYRIYSRNLRPRLFCALWFLRHDFGFIFTPCIYYVLTEQTEYNAIIMIIINVIIDKS
jgi:hypothetical protein